MPCSNWIDHKQQGALITCLKLSMIFLLTFSALMTFAQGTGKISVSGTVVSGNGRPVTGVSVIIAKNLGTTTDTAGKFSIGDLQRGTYKIAFRCLYYGRKDTVVTVEGKNLNGLIFTLPANCKSLNQRKALGDIRKSKAVIFVNSKPKQSDKSSNEQFREKYGIAFEFNDFELPAEDCMIIYNRTIFTYLDSKFGNQWRDEIKVEPVGFPKQEQSFFNSSNR